MSSPTRRTFLQLGAATAIPNIGSRGTNFDEPTQIPITPINGKSSEEVAAEAANVLKGVRENSDIVAEKDIKRAANEFCSNWEGFIDKFQNGFALISTSLARYIARTAGDAIRILQNQLNLNLSDLTEVLEETLDTTIANLPKFLEEKLEGLLDHTFGNLDNLIKKSSRLVPILGALVGMSANGCEYTNKSQKLKSVKGDRREKLQEQVEEAKEDFLICCIILVADIVLMVFGIPYRAAFSGTRKIANTLLWRIRSTVGFDVFSVILKTVHWVIRGTVEESTRLIAEEIDEAEKVLEGVDIDYSESELLEVGYNESNVDALNDRIGDNGKFNDEDSANNIIDDESGQLIDLPNVSALWNNSKDDISYFPG